MLIRDARTGDADDVAVLLDDLGYPASHAQVAARLERVLADPASRILVAEVDGAVVGLVATHLVPREIALGASTFELVPRQTRHRPRRTATPP